MQTLKAVKIRMRRGCLLSSDLRDIESIFIIGNCDWNDDFYKADFLCRFLIRNPGSIYLHNNPAALLLPGICPQQGEFVKSQPRLSPRDLLLKLPREECDAPKQQTPGPAHKKHNIPTQKK